MNLLSPSAQMDLIEKILHEYHVMQNIFDPLFRKFGTDSSFKQKKATSDLSSLSMFAALWSARYEIVNCHIETLPQKQQVYERTKKNLPIYLVRNIVKGIFTRSGDKVLTTYYYNSNNDRLTTYDVMPDQQYIKDMLYQWVKDSMSHSLSIKSPRKETITFLMIASSRYRSAYGQSRYDLEHMFDQKAFKGCKGIAGNAIGNLFFLAEKTNRGKKDNSLYSMQDQHDGLNFDSEYLEYIHYPSKSIYDQAKSDIFAGAPTLANELIEQRGYALIDDLIYVLYANQTQ